jgi:probable addiction module antidote protein
MMSGRSRSYKAGLYRRLLDDVEAMNYLQAALQDSQSAFLVALRNVVEARQITKVARESSLDRVNIYRMLSGTGNPRLSSLEKILHALGLRLAISVEDANPSPKNVRANQWHMPWHVSLSRKINSCYGSITYGADLWSSTAPEPGVVGCEHTFAASSDEMYRGVLHPAHLNEREEFCEIAY